MSDSKIIEHRPITAALAAVPPGNRPGTSEPVHRRVQAALDEAKHIANLARELSIILTGSAPQESTRDHSPPSNKGMFQILDFQAGELAKRLDDIRQTIEHIRGQV